MPKSKFRNRNHPKTHYNPNSGKRLGSMPGPKFLGKKHEDESEYMGSVITGENRRSYIEGQKQLFKQRFNNEIDLKIQEIVEDDVLNQNEKDIRLGIIENDRISDEKLEEMSDRFARFQANKEVKHYNAYKKGKPFFIYMGRRFPVLTEKFIKDSKSIKDIIKVENNENFEGIVG